MHGTSLIPKSIRKMPGYKTRTWDTCIPDVIMYLSDIRDIALSILHSHKPLISNVSDWAGQKQLATCIVNPVELPFPTKLVCEGVNSMNVKGHFWRECDCFFHTDDL